MEQVIERDGRRLRSADSRARIVAAMLGLIQEGEVSPGAEPVAARAEVGLRTVFRHFKDMDSLYREMAQVVEGQIRAVAAEPFASTDVAGRMKELVERRSRAFETMAPFRRAMDVHRLRSGAFSTHTSKMVAEMRAILQRVLPAELTANRPVFEALDLLLSFETWRRLRGDQQLSVAEARQVLEAVLLKIAG